jgi:Domain of unknown function (DUF6457)
MSRMDEWLAGARDTLADVASLDAADLDLDEESAEIILDLARIAAHDSGERTNAPLLCYVVGLARRGDADLKTLADAVRQSSS